MQNTSTAADFQDFIAQSFTTLDPSTVYAPNWHIELIAEYLQAISNEEIKRLIINLPPRYLKSISVSVAWPAWLLGHDPTKRIIVASYSQALSQKHSLDCRTLMKSEPYQQQFPDTQISTEHNRKDKFMTTQGGFRLATSVDSSLLGEGGDILILDDPYSPNQVMSKTRREHVLRWFNQTFMTRLNHKKKGAVVIIMQRLHPDDLTGHLVKHLGRFWEHLVIPVEEKETTTYAFKNFEKVREAGEYLQPSREGKEEIEQLKIELGSYTFSSQYQQNPTPMKGVVLKKEWLRYYDSLPQNPELIVHSWDTAIKADQQNHYSVCTIWYIYGNQYYLYHVMRKRMEYPELKNAIIKLSDSGSPIILIEDKASGSSLIQDLRHNVAMPVIPMQPKHDKLIRFAAACCFFESGNVYLPHETKTPNSWFSDYETELLLFPNDDYDDQVDSTSQFFQWVRDRGGLSYKISRL